MRRIGAVFLACLAPVAWSDQAATDKVLSCMRANIPPTVRIQTVEVTAFDRTGGERTLKGKLYGTREKDRAQIMMHIEGPPDLAGASYLVREGERSDEMYLYLPAVQKVRRITGASLDGQLWGTDLSYNDFKQIQNAFSGAKVGMEPETRVGEVPVHVLSFTPSQEQVGRYKRIRAMVDQKTCVALTVEFIDSSGVHKVMSVSPGDVRKSGGHWYASALEMKDLRSETRTTVRVLGVTSGDKLSRRYFNPQTFYLGN